MTDDKIKAVHRQRAALVYIRQSTAAQVEHNRESTARQYALVERACDLGWAKEQVMVIDEDLAITASIVGHRAGFERMASEVALGPNRDHPGHRGCAVGAQQCQLVPAVGPVCGHRYIDRRQRWLVPSGVVQRSIGPWPEGDDERSGTARHSGSARWRYSQQSATWRAAARVAGGIGLGREGW